MNRRNFFKSTLAGIAGVVGALHKSKEPEVKRTVINKTAEVGFTSMSTTDSPTWTVYWNEEGVMKMARCGEGYEIRYD